MSLKELIDSEADNFLGQIIGEKNLSPRTRISAVLAVLAGVDERSVAYICNYEIRGQASTFEMDQILARIEDSFLTFRNGVFERNQQEVDQRRAEIKAER